MSSRKTSGSRYVKPATGVKKYVLDKYFAFMQRYSKTIELRFPKVYKVYRVFAFGEEFYRSRSDN